MAMEVHHHSHTARKKWTHYFWEFLMLFLAVFCGFLAENQREHFVEHQREKQFMQSLYNDVKTDTSNLAAILRARIAREQRIDSLSHLMNSERPEQFSGKIYALAIPISRTLPYRFVPTDGTMQQLKNSGGLRLIRKKGVVDSIAKYDLAVRNIAAQTLVEENLAENYRTASAKIFDALVFDKLMDEDANVIGLPRGNPPFPSFTRRELQEWNYRLYSLKTINKGNRRDARSLSIQAVNLLKTLKKNYDLE
jgi:hypothetical protein